MGSRRTYGALRRRAAIALGVWAVALSMLAVAAAIPEGLEVHLTVSSPTPVVDQTVWFNASVRANHDESSSHHLSYRFDFGDGTGTDWQASSNTTHAYTVAGNYTASVAAKDREDHKGSASVRVTVLPPPPAVPDVRPVLAALIPVRPAVGDFVNLTVVLLNRGTAPALTATLTAMDQRPNGTTASLGSSVLTEPLAPSNVTPVVLGPFRATSVGNHTLRIRVTGVTPLEANPDRGVLNFPMTVIPSPPPPAPTGPQLRLLAGLLDPARPRSGDPVNLSVVVWNAGTAAAQSATLAAYDVPPNGTMNLLSRIALADPLSPSMGETVSFPAFLASTPGNHTLRILVENVTPPALRPGGNELDVAMAVSGTTPPPPPNQGPPPFEFGPLAFALAGAAVASGAAAALILLRPRPSAIAAEPPPATPPDHSPPPIWPP